MANRTLPRLKSFSYRGRYSYFVTCCVAERRSAFTSHDRVNCVRSEFLRTAEQMRFAIPAGVFMSDHVHLLVEGLTDTSDFKRFMTLMRQRSAVAFSRRFRERLWQKGYHERVLRNPDEVPSIVKYIADNARSAGIESADSYPYLWTPTQEGPGLKAETRITSASVTPG